MKKYPFVIVGAGAGGLVIAIGLAKAGKKVLLIEKGHYGGDCTNYGCVPSKALISAAEIAHSITHSNDYGINVKDPSFNADEALKRVRRIVSEIKEHEEPEALEKIGLETLTGTASFKDPHSLEVKLESGETTNISGENIILAAGSSPVTPDLPGLDKTPFLNNERIFDLEKIPKRMVFLGGGPIGVELAMAMCKLGSEVSLVHSHSHLLQRESKNAQDVIENSLKKNGMKLFLNSKVESVSHDGKNFTTKISYTHQPEDSISLESDELMISTGRKPNIEALKLDQGKIKHSKHGIDVDSYGRTSQKHVWAVGDITGAPFFTHYAENQARTVLQNLLVPIKSKKSTQDIPRVTFTDPEVASIGITEEEAIKKYSQASVKTYYVPFSEVDRAITSSREDGFLEIVTKRLSSRILGATIVGPRAGEMLMEVSTAMYFNIPLKKLASIIHPYPIFNACIRKAADKWLLETLIPFLKNPFKKVA